MLHRLLPAGVAIITAAAAYLLGQHTAEGRPLMKKHKKVMASSNAPPPCLPVKCTCPFGIRSRLSPPCFCLSKHHILDLCPACCKGCRHAVQAFLLVIKQEYKSLRDRDEFIRLFEPLAKYVTEHEKTTLAYELSISDKDPHKVIIFERYCENIDQHDA